MRVADVEADFRSINLDCDDARYDVPAPNSVLEIIMDESEYDSDTTDMDIDTHTGVVRFSVQKVEFCPPKYKIWTISKLLSRKLFLARGKFELQNWNLYLCRSYRQKSEVTRAFSVKRESRQQIDSFRKISIWVRRHQPRRIWFTWRVTPCPSWPRSVSARPLVSDWAHVRQP